MRKPYHLCMSGGDELICRSEEDHIRLFNCIAIASYETDSVLLADAEMSTHAHLGLRSERPEAFLARAWNLYTRYFNSRYRRRGHLGEKHPFVLELEGYHHLLAAICYILRNPLHHGVSPTPFGYPYSSANVYFRKELGKDFSEEPIRKKSMYKYLPRLDSYPPEYRMSESGIYLRESVIDVAEVESMFVTPRSFLFNMNRLSGEEWKAEQEKDNNGLDPVTLDVIENGIKLTSIERMLVNEAGKANYRAVSDMELCSRIDNDIVPDLGKESVYDLSPHDVRRIADFLSSTYRISERKVLRCLAASYDR